MGRIFITGDLHGDHDAGKLNMDNFPEQKELTKDDYVIICGDFGNVWFGDRKCPDTVRDAYDIPDALKSEWGKDTYMLNWLEQKNFTTLFVDGNHENHALLSCYPMEEWMGGMVHKIRPGIIHLCRGQLFDINGSTFFAMGGAPSHDTMYRKEGISWWPEEMPDTDEYAEARYNLARVGWKVDYILTHEATMEMIGQMDFFCGNNELAEFLSEVEGKVEYKKWFFGHYHLDDCRLDDQIGLYKRIVELEI